MVRPPMRTREEIRADVRALEKETKGRLGEMLGAPKQSDTT